ncbi:hypothetical protein MKEN_00811800 [Mycena kentingensis (nom. inval.)]|nr:hypothetical protein MKEN_00811800 [Mycena kentingensis (nom. inval.)]
MHTLPFLEPLDAQHALFNPGPAHCWYSLPKDYEAILLFIPGNPGFADFYVPFFTSLMEHNPRLGVIARGHLGHSGHACSEHGLTAQVQSAIEMLDAIRASTPVPIVLAGHSVGAWIALQVLKARSGSGISQVQLLFPTIRHIADSPNGRRLSWLFRPPFPRIISWLSYLTRPLPISLLFSRWPASQTTVLRSLLNSPPAIYACLSMAHDEMKAICEMDAIVKDERVRILFGEHDDWVGASNKSAITVDR